MGTLWGRDVVTVYIRPSRHTKAFVDAAGSYTVPWVDYSLIAGGAIVVVFAALMAFWWIRSHGKNAR